MKVSRDRLQEINQAIDNRRIAKTYSYYPQDSWEQRCIDREMSDKITDVIEGRVHKE